MKFYEKLSSSSRVLSCVQTSDGWTEVWSDFISKQSCENTQERKSELCIGLDELFYMAMSSFLIYRGERSKAVTPAYNVAMHSMAEKSPYPSVLNM